MPSVILAIALLIVGLAAPRPVAACLCGEPGEYRSDVIFTGTVTDAPDGRFAGVAGVYGFDVDQVLVGEVGDGRVYTSDSYGGCGRFLEMGGRYLVHAERGEPSADPRRPDDVALVTSSCHPGRDLTPIPRDSASAWPVIPLASAALVLATAVGLFTLRAGGIRRQRT
jgi:hypothetical protein